MSDIKKYILNKDFAIECEIGSSMAIRVVLVSVSFEPVIEEIKGIRDKNTANQKFKELAQKYKTGVGFARSQY